MTRELFDSFWRAVAYCLHPKVIALSLAPLVIVGGAAAALGYFYWEPALAGVRASLDESALLEPLFAWLRSIGAGNWASVLVPLVVVAVAMPVFVVATLLVAALLMTPAIVRLVAARRFPHLEARHGGSFWSGVAVSLGCTVVAVVALVLSIPFWFVPPLVLVLPPLIWGWLTYRVFGYDVLATHASRDERLRLLDDERWPLLGMGIACGAMGAAPSLLWAVSALALVLAPFLILLSIWLYTLVFAFSSLWFAHYLLAALERLRRDESNVAATAPGPAPTMRNCRPCRHQALPHEHRTSHRRRRDPVGQARRQALAQGHRAARRARSRFELGTLRRRRPARITADLKDAFASGDLVFSCGGIGATPDDHTRQCAAAALGVPLVLHPQARDFVDRADEGRRAREAARPSIPTARTTATGSTWRCFRPAPRSSRTRTTRSPDSRSARARAACSSSPAFRSWPGR